MLVTANDQANRVFNGDTGVVVEGDGGMEVALASGDVLRRLAPSRLDQVETWWAMTVHKSQGSEFPHAVVSLPGPQSPILTRELLYTAVTTRRGPPDHRGQRRSGRAGHRPPTGPGLGPAGPPLARLSTDRPVGVGRASGGRPV